MIVTVEFPDGTLGRLISSDLNYGRPEHTVLVNGKYVTVRSSEVKIVSYRRETNLPPTNGIDRESYSYGGRIR